MMFNDLRLEHPEITRARNLGTSVWDDLDDLAAQFEGTCYDEKKKEIRKILSGF